MPTRSDPPLDPRRALGRHGERLAAEHLRRRGYAVLARNVRTARGEIDLIASEGTTLVFAEVKTRRVRGRPREDQLPLAGLRGPQRTRLRQLASAWLTAQSARPRMESIRFDAIGVMVDGRGRAVGIEHVENAW
jgi:putative endonuclease